MTHPLGFTVQLPQRHHHPEALDRGGPSPPPAWHLLASDCFAISDGLPSIAADAFDLCITDPPYSQHVHSKSRRGLTGTHTGGATDQISQRRELGFEHIQRADMESCALHLARIVRRWTLVFCDVESSHLWADALRAAGLEYLRTMAWIKLGGAPQFTGDRPAVAFEAIVLAHRPGKKTWNGGGKAGLYSVPTAIDRDRSGLDKRIHTTQKPLALMEQLALDFSVPGEMILDPFAGSGTTGVAALRLGRRFLGWERDANMHAKAAQRLRATRSLPAGYHGSATQGALW